MINKFNVEVIQAVTNKVAGIDILFNAVGQWSGRIRERICQ